MKAVILCGGQGTRLREETEFKPKPLVEVGGMPILWHIMKIFSHYGVKEFILPLGYKGDLIKQFFMDFSWRANDFTLNFADKSMDVHDNHKNEDWIIHFVDTGVETKTALRLKKISHLLSDDELFFLTYGDGVADIDIAKLLEFHKKNKRLLTLTGVNIDSRFGELSANNSLLIQFNEKPKESSLINGGFMVVSKEFVNHLSDEDLMLEEQRGPISTLAKKGEVSIYLHDGFWNCMDTYRDYQRLNEIWAKGAKWKIWND